MQGRKLSEAQKSIKAQENRFDKQRRLCSSWLHAFTRSDTLYFLADINFGATDFAVSDGVFLEHIC